MCKIRNSFDYFQVESNGVVSFNTPLDRYSSVPLPISGRSFIAPYWADVDLRGIGEIYYRQTTNSVLLARATNEVNTLFPNQQSTNITNLFIVTWDTVGYYPHGIDRVRSNNLYY